MCGILLHKGNDQITSRFHENLEKLSHRGPDFKHFIHLNDIYIGHTRLSIIDLSDLGNQPMVSNCSNYILSFNGEIYNYEELKAELIKLGYEFKTKTDSEVLLYGFIEYEEDILNKVEGIFAFIIYDILNNKIFFARDHFGVKPLYYYRKSNNFVISSETRVFENFTKKDEMTKILFLSHGYIPTPKTLYEDVFSLRPGHYGVFKNNKVETFQYFDLSKIFLKKSNGFKKSYLLSAIKNQMISDAKIGCFLSGGIDSSIISSVISKNYKNIETYSLRFEGSYDESIYQKKMIDKFQFNSKHQKLNFNDFKKMIDKFISSMDQPTIDGFNTYFVSKLAKNNKVKVSFSGIGSDEIFYGYPVHKSITTKKLIKIIFKLIPKKLLPNRLKKIDYLKLKNDYGIYLSQRGIFSLEEISKLLSIDESIIIDYINSFVKDDLQKVSHLNYIDKMGFFELTKYMEGQLLRDTDVFGMSNSIEIRVPFLDKNLVQNVLPVRNRKKTYSNINKILLVEKFKDFLPKEIYKRGKKGFELPFNNWFSQFNLYEKLYKEDKKIKPFKNSHWSKLWALNIMKNKY